MKSTPNDLKGIREKALMVALNKTAIVAETDVNGIITYANDKFLDISEYQKEEVIGKTHKIINSGVHPKSFMESLWKTIKSGEVWRGEICNKSKFGKIYWVDTCIAPIFDDNNKIVNFIAIRFDITEKKILAEKLLAEVKSHQDSLALLNDAKEKAENANHAKDSFLATMSHEIRTPLTGLLGMMELLSLTPMEKEQHATLNIAWDSGRGLLRIVNDILDWSKIEEGKLDLAPRPTSIEQMLQEVVNTYSPVASAKDLTLWHHSDARLSSAHIFDSLRVSQILNNFVSNSIKFTNNGEIEVRAILIKKLDGKERIRFSVKDTGIGIPKETHKKLFQFYQQESADTARMYGGTGLGLAICKRLAELMDGELNLESEINIGSTFSITLTLSVSNVPAEEIQSRSPDVAKRAIKPLFSDYANSPLILAVDDHPTNRDLIGKQIKLLGLRYELAESGSDALSMWKTGRFALIISDCHMPGMDGYELAKSIRKIEADLNLKRTPVIAWTANALAEEGKHCHNAGMDDLLTKPADLDQLKKMFLKWILGKKIEAFQAIENHSDDIAGNSEPIDLSLLRKSINDNSIIQKMMLDYYSQVVIDVTYLNKMLDKGNLKEIIDSAHRIKGASLMIGAKKLGNTCAEIESEARLKNLELARGLKNNLAHDFEQIENYCKQLKNIKI